MELIGVDTSERHYHICKVWLEDTEITKWLSSPLRFGKYYNMIHRKLISDRRNRLFLVCVDGETVGLTGFLNIDRVDKRAEVWYLIGTASNRGKEYATNAVRLLKRMAKEDLQFVSLYAHVAKPNTASIRVLEKCGFEYVGEFRNAFLLDGSYTDLLIYDWIGN